MIVSVPEPTQNVGPQQLKGLSMPLRSIRRVAVLTTALLPLGAALIAAAPTSQADTVHPLVTCIGHHTVDFTEGLKDATEVHHVTGVSHYGVDDTEGTLNRTTGCKPGMNGAIQVPGAITYPGATVTVNVTETASCTQPSSSSTSWTGTIKWRNALGAIVATSTLSNGTFPINDKEHGDGIVKAMADVTAGPGVNGTYVFHGDVNATTPNACSGGTTGIKHETGTDSFSIY
ncbi:hypothetical protein [Streptomyces sp. FIT100]|uniref:hypothetical protein n=1 Tax=Streptomyces sp. FIT100 TaxID=2837956 RepID=UPI0021CACA9B|nr:hypothetical protein [Streptomyces sp. FIT100]UUN25267.1 hypothetical protein KK483_01685 [Streptomyces sp. FIT100]